MAASSTLALPEDLLAQVLQSIDQQERITMCSLVNSGWKKAVKHSLSRLECNLHSSAQYRSLSDWLNSKSSCCRISSIRYIEVGWNQHHPKCRIGILPALQLPYYKLSNLQTLKLQHCLLRPASITSTTAEAVETSSAVAEVSAPSVPALSALTALTQLQLDRCCVKLCELSSCTQLQHLHLCLMTFSEGQVPASGGVMQPVETALAAALPQLQCLTLFSIDTCPQVRDSRLLDFAPISAALGSLQQLQVLQLGDYVAIPDSSYPHLPVSLHTLQISSHASDIPATAASHWRKLTNLQQLQLGHLRIEDKTVLLSCTQLTRLALQFVTFSSLDIYGEDDDSDESYDPLDVTDVKLLSVLPVLKQLRHLYIWGCLENELHIDDLYAAITVNSQLTHLDLSHCCIPPSAARHIFVPGHCEKLVKLHTPPSLVDFCDSYGLLVSCCPALQYLEIGNSACCEMNEEVSCTGRARLL